jgi:hypothetical protein
MYNERSYRYRAISSRQPLDGQESNKKVLLKFCILNILFYMLLFLNFYHFIIFILSDPTGKLFCGNKVLWDHMYLYDYCEYHIQLINK